MQASQLSTFDQFDTLFSMRLHQLIAFSLLIIVTHLGGCASSTGPTELIIAPAQYHAVFDAAVEATRREGMPALTMDRRNGLIETDVRNAGSIFEPWQGDNASFAQAMENTITHQRRRVRFEFSPADQPAVNIVAPEPIKPIDVSGVNESAIDLTTHSGDILLNVVVTIERQNRVGIRRNTWSRRLTTLTKIGGKDENLPNTHWTPVSRDEAFEKRLLANIREMIAAESES